MGWAVTNWVILEGRAIKDNVISGGSSFLDYPIMHFLSYVEYILREDEETSRHIDDLYGVALLNTNTRRQAIREALAAFGG